MADWQDVGDSDGWADVGWEDVKPKQASMWDAVKQAGATAGTAMDYAISVPAGALASVFSQEEGDKIFRQMEANRAYRQQWANPENLPTSMGQDLAGMAATAPLQVLGMMGGPAMKGTDLVSRGESLPRAMTATGVEAGLTAAGVGPMAAARTFGGRAAIGAGTNVALGAGADAATQFLAEQEATKKAYDPYDVHRRATEAVAGGVLQGAFGERPISKPATKLDIIRAQTEAARPVDQPKTGQMNLFDQFDEGMATPYDAGMMGVSEPISPKLQRRQMELPFGEERGPLNVDPQGQVFRGDVRDPMAQIALEQQGRAFEWELGQGTIPEGLPKGEPLPFLQEGKMAPLPEVSRIGEPFKIPIKQRGGVNPEVFREGFEKVKEFGEYTLQLLGRQNGPEVRIFDKQGNDIGGVSTSAKYTGREQNLEADFTKVIPQHQGKGLAEAAYKFLADTGSDIKQSATQLPEGRKMWEGFEKRGVSKGGYIPKGQRGALLIGEKTGIENALTKTEDDTFIPKNPNVTQALEQALAEGKDGKQWNYLQSGSTSTAMKSGSAAIKAASEIVQNAVKRADLAIRNWVFPAERALKGLPRESIIELAALFKEEMFKGERFPADILANNLSVKELKAYTAMRDLFDDTLAAQNAARVAKGQEPITASEAYMSSRWKGDFRRPVKDAKGKLVWYLADSTKLGLEAQSKALKKQFPDLVVDKSLDHTVRSSTSKTDLQSMYSTMLDILGRDDPAIQKIAQAIEEQTVAEGSLTLAQEKHLKGKGNIRGFMGDRPGVGVEIKGKTFYKKADPLKQSLAMFQQQIQYAKNAYKWSEMQKAADDIKGLVSNPELQAQQPNNVKYIREYFKNAIGHGESAAMRAIDDSLRKGLGFSPEIINKGVGGLKSFFILQKLAASAGYTIANLIQTSNVLPSLALLYSKGYKGNPITAMAVGLPAGMMMATAHYLKSVGGEYLSKLPNQFMKDAIQYAEDNGVTARSVYDESPLSSSFSRIGQVANIAAKTMTIPETFVRSVAFMTYAQMLKDSGKFKDMSKLFQMAEEYVNQSMVDYRETERPMVFAKLGATGNFLNTLQTYPMSFYNQWALMTKEASKGNVVPFATALALQYGIAGAMGLPYFDDTVKLFSYIRDNFVPTGVWARMQKSPFLSNPKLWLVENVGNAALWGALSDWSGIGMTSRVAAPGVGAMLQSPAGPVMDIAKQVGHVGSAIMDPSKGKLAQAAMSVAPVGLQGALETSPMMEGLTYNKRPNGTEVSIKSKDLAARKGGYERTPEEVAMRRFGLRSQKEVVARELAYETSEANRMLDVKSSELVGKYYDAIRQGNAEKANQLNTLYYNLTGKGLVTSQMEEQIKEEMYTDVEKLSRKGSTPQKMLNIVRMDKLMEQHKQ